MLSDVDRTLDTHALINHEGPGRRGLGHITRGGVLLLCAAWELYVEEVIIEGVDFFIANTDLPTNLPEEVQKELSREVRSNKHELRPLELAGEGWKDLYRNHVSASVASLNTPKSGNLDPMFRRFLGVETISAAWTVGTEAVNQFVGVRGDIAHRGRDAHYVTINNLSAYKDLVSRAAIDTDNFLSEYLRDKTPGRARPWNRRQV